MEKYCKDCRWISSCGILCEHEKAIRSVSLISGDKSYFPCEDMRRWVKAKELFCVGSTVAHALCEEFGFDPEEKVLK